MSHATSLRAIGQSLEAARVANFQIENSGDNYLVLSNSLTHRLVRFTPAHIARLDAQGQKQRQHHSQRRTRVVNRLSQALRNLGDHLDNAQTRAFHISWMSRSVSVNYKSLGGQSEHRMFTAKELQQHGLPSRRQRTSPRDLMAVL